jgi:hypothetical protein
MAGDMNDLLTHVPKLVKAYGRWPSFLYVVFATVVAHRGRVIAGSALLILGFFKLFH